jgi:hypothetical protein
MRNKRNFNKSNTRVVNNAITLPYTIRWSTEELGRPKSFDYGNVLEQYFGDAASSKFYGYMSSISVEAADIEAVIWNGIVYQPINSNRRYKVKGPLSKINISTNETDYTLQVQPREGTVQATIAVTIVTREFEVH